MISEELENQLSEAIEADNATRLSELLEQYSININANILKSIPPATAEDRETLLMNAAKHEATECMQLLLARPDIDVNAADTYMQQTALMYAVEYEKPDSVRLLITRKDLDVNAKHETGGNVMDHAVMCTNIECLNLLFSHKDLDVKNNGGTSIVDTLLHNNIELAKLLLDFGIDADYIRGNFYTTLTYCAKDNRHEFVKLLLDHGVDVNHTDGRGNTAVKLAMEHVKPDHDTSVEGYIVDGTESMRLLVGYGAELPDAATGRFSIPEERLNLCNFLKQRISTSAAGIATVLAEPEFVTEVKTLTEKIATRLIFSLDVTTAQITNPAFLDSAMMRAKVIMTSIDQRIDGYEKSTQEFILDNAHFIDFSLDRDFKSWNVKDVGVKTTLVNLAYICGGPVKHIESLMGSRPQAIQKFIQFIPTDETGNTLKYSVEEFKLGVVSKFPFEALGVAIGDSKVVDIVAELISSFLSADDVVSMDMSLSPETALAGDGLTHGPADAEA